MMKRDIDILNAIPAKKKYKSEDLKIIINKKLCNFIEIESPCRP